MNVISSFIADKYYPSRILTPYSHSENFNEHANEDLMNFSKEKAKENIQLELISFLLFSSYLIYN